MFSVPASSSQLGPNVAEVITGFGAAAVNFIPLFGRSDSSLASTAQTPFGEIIDAVSHYSVITFPWFGAAAVIACLTDRQTVEPPFYHQALLFDLISNLMQLLGLGCF